MISHAVNNHKIRVLMQTVSTIIATIKLHNNIHINVRNFAMKGSADGEFQNERTHSRGIYTEMKEPYKSI